MALVDSLLSAMVRADGDALVMHVGERPYVVTQAGTLDLSTHGLNLGAMTGMLQQLLPAEQQSSLEEFGAVEHTLPSLGDDRFTLVAARGGDDIWIEIRRRRSTPAVAVAAPAAAPPPVVQEQTPASAYARNDSGELRRDLAEAAFGREGGPIAQPILVAATEVPVPEMVAATIELIEPVESVESVELVEPAESVEPAYARYDSVAEVEVPIPDMVGATIELIEPVESAYARADSDELRRDSAEAASGREGEPVELVAPPQTPELDPAVLLDQLIPVDDPDVEEMPLELVAAIEAEQAAEQPLPAFVAPMTAELHQPAVELASAVDHVETARVEPVESAYARDNSSESVEPAEPVERAEPVEPAAARDPYVVLPMTRTVRIEVPTRVMSQSRTSTVERLLQIAAARGASSLFLTSDSRPYIRVEGDIRSLDGEAMLSKAEIEAAVMEIVPEEVQDSVGRGEATEWIAELPELGCIRCTSFRDHRGPGVVFNMIATRAATAEQLALPREVQAFATEAEGLVLVAGPRGSGKSTLMSALIDLVNRQRTDYVIMLERQIRLVHDNRTALVSQREIRGGADEALAAARAALRENPDVLVVDDLSSAQMVPLLLEAAAGGLLVFVSITAPSTADAVERLLELAPPGTRTSVQAAMAETFRGAVSQLLLKKTGGGRVVAREIMLPTAAVTRLIGDGQLGQLPLALEGGRRHGMVPLTDVLLGLVQSGVVDVREAFRKTHDRDRLLSGLKREGVDTSVVERLA